MVPDEPMVKMLGKAVLDNKSSVFLDLRQKTRKFATICP